jgi:hypothetical protein
MYNTRDMDASYDVSTVLLEHLSLEDQVAAHVGWEAQIRCWESRQLLSAAHDHESKDVHVHAKTSREEISEEITPISLASGLPRWVGSHRQQCYNTPKFHAVFQWRAQQFL